MGRTPTGDYLAHRAELQPRLSNGAELLVERLNLHDAQIHSFEYRPHEAFVLRALTGDLQVGYEFLELSFADAELRLGAGLTVEVLNLLDARTEIIHDEIDIEAEDRFTHRVLLWPAGEYEVVFTGLTEKRELATPNDRR